MSATLAVVATRLREDGGLLAAALVEADAAPTPHGDAVGRRFAVAVEAIREGYLLHYGASRLLAVDADRDLALLAGDRLYALGLAELAAIGDLRAVRAMAAVIARGAAAQAAGDAAAAEEAWATGTRTLALDR
ncbi:MAG TPA: hypothetical protein VHB30_06155 [Solirubrobacteraceae bacterium]|nr:hypothetical protein [Solirubrobacteraceae bacterium]